MTNMDIIDEIKKLEKTDYTASIGNSKYEYLDLGEGNYLFRNRTDSSYKLLNGEDPEEALWNWIRTRDSYKIFVLQDSMGGMQQYDGKILGYHCREKAEAERKSILEFLKKCGHGDWSHYLFVKRRERMDLEIEKKDILFDYVG